MPMTHISHITVLHQKRVYTHSGTSSPVYTFWLNTNKGSTINHLGEGRGADFRERIFFWTLSVRFIFFLHASERFFFFWFAPRPPPDD